MNSIRNIVLALTLTLPMTVHAQVNENLAQFAPDIEAARTIMQTERKILIMREMALTSDEAAAFWPLYDEYVVARRELGDMRIKVITDYAANYETMTNKLARSLSEDSLSYESKVLKLKKKYIKKFRKVLPDIKVLRYFQLENKLDAIIEFDLASEIPLMK
ncbi:MAG: hypothetical protein GY727_09180 [Gammaproteobacteria bacterium]|nr:hypothetical protein [Gammaproteobacteria bacterium]MCP4089535.1 hypothetical protein [Gammaproteobacteria bacterium]MCP4276241.1 hypothetical protein [Gammaproteobacteria bacterium]MCP4832938.1 hypothetical protein [Gammaproteobacteria bacterium]MCP4930063.1 hypothetical protein [Gammaproteobacteria bacterium]